MSTHRYIVVDGPIGAGKTSLAGILAEELQARLYREQIDENPFLSRFYDDPERYAFPTQLAFLLARHRQQEELAKSEQLGQNVIADYSFAKDAIFANMNLQDDERALYDQLFEMFRARARRPDLVVYLQARVDVLLSRIRKRSKTYERHITPQYIEQVAEAYREYFFHYEETPLLVVDCSRIDFVSRAEDTVDLIEKIREMGQGVQHYIPLGSR